MVPAPKICAPTALLLCLSLSPSFAATVHFGDFKARNLAYLNVTEKNNGPESLLGTPATHGDSLRFPFDGFQAGTNGAAASEVGSQLSMQLDADPQMSLDMISVGITGDYTLTGQPGAAASASAEAILTWKVLEVDGVGLADGPSGTANLQFDHGSGPHGGVFELPGDMGNAVLWKGTATIDAAAKIQPLFPGQAITKLELTIDHLLKASAAAPGAAAFIKLKANDGIQVQVAQVPEPATWVLGTMLVAAFALRRRPANVN